MISNDKIINCKWISDQSNTEPMVSTIVNRNVGIEGIEINRFACQKNSEYSFSRDDGHIFSLVGGDAFLTTNEYSTSLHLSSGCHVYIPPASDANIRFEQDSTAIHAAADSQRSRGARLIIHDERFLSPYRFVLTPQYLSRRAFLHRDKTLISKSGDPVAWFHTTMFDTQGLSRNNDGLEVFKMSYDYQSEVNVVYDVAAGARVRFAHHPYSNSGQQLWSDWAELDNNTTYYLNESADGEFVETYIDEASTKPVPLRNRHEVFIEPGSHVSLCCLFDPAPTGTEIHRPGEYSSYGPVADTLASSDYSRFLAEAAIDDKVIESLSLMIASDPGSKLAESSHWKMFLSAAKQAISKQEEMIGTKGKGRESIIAPWRIDKSILAS